MFFYIKGFFERLYDENDDYSDIGKDTSGINAMINLYKGRFYLENCLNEIFDTKGIKILLH